MNTDAPYSYNALPESHIRLIEIHDSSKSDSISCRFRECDIDHCPPFIALSYAWGPPASDDTIQLHERSFTIRRNLASFFKHFLWVHGKGITCYHLRFRMVFLVRSLYHFSRSTRYASTSTIYRSAFIKLG
jgi:hypothetical protein